MPSESPPQSRATMVLATTAVLAVLYVARSVLVPITLAVFLSLLIAPLVHRLQRIGLNHTWAVLATVMLIAFGFTAVAVTIGSQIVGAEESLPQYADKVQRKLERLSESTLGRITAWRGRADRVLHGLTDVQQQQTPVLQPPAPQLEQPDLGGERTPIPVEVREPPTSPLQLVEGVLASVWAPLQTTGIVLIVLIFVLLEHETLRDRFIRIAGGDDLRGATVAINDAGERLSRFFVSQFTVNLAVGALVGLGLAVLGIPHAVICGALTAVLRFVPYIGVWIAALFAALLGFAVGTGWSLAAATVGLFVIVEVIAAQLVEPQLYGHTTGMSPLSVVIAAIFWSWLWGPIGLIVSTPLTLCLLVAGRHTRTFRLLNIMLSDSQALTMPQKFYQRALSADSAEMISAAKLFLKRRSFAAYCDTVLMPAMHLARLDLQSGAIDDTQQAEVRNAVVRVIAALGRDTQKRARQRPISVLDHTGPGRLLRQQREELYGRWQGPTQVPTGSVTLGVSLGSSADDLATELLVRILRDQRIDARHLSLEDLRAPPPPNANPNAISIVYLVSAFPGAEREQSRRIIDELRTRFPRACIVTMFLPGMVLQATATAAPADGGDAAATSFSDAVRIPHEWHAPPAAR